MSVKVKGRPALDCVGEALINLIDAIDDRNMDNLPARTIEALYHRIPKLALRVDKWMTIRKKQGADL